MKCSLCGAETKGEKINFKLKYYTENLLTFASDFKRKNYKKSNMVLCDHCADAIEVGENYVLNNMQHKFGTSTCVIVPHVIFGDLEAEEMINVSENLDRVFTLAMNVQDLEEYDEALIDLYNSYDKKHVLMAFHVMFLKQRRQETKILKLIEDIPFTFFDKLENAVMYTDSWMEQFHPKVIITKKGLEGVYYLSGYQRHGIEFVAATLKGQPLNKNNVLQEKLKILKKTKQDINLKKYLKYNIINKEYSVEILKWLDILDTN